MNANCGCRLFGLAYLQYGPDDLVIAGAAAEVACQPVTDTAFVGVGFLVQQALGSQQESRGADAALEGGVLQERLLQRVQALGRGHALDGRDVLALGFNAQDQARVNDPAIQDDGAGTANPLLAAHMGAGQAQVGCEQGI